MRVLYATDGFEPSLQAGLLLDKLGDRDRVHITVMSVTHTGLPLPEHLPIVLDSAESRRADSQAIVDAAAKKLSVAGFETTSRTSEGHPGQEIVRSVEDESFDLVVIGAGNKSWLGSKLLGSVSTYVLHASPSSVLIAHEANSQGTKARVLLGVDGSTGSQSAAAALTELTSAAQTEIVAVAVVPPYMSMAFPPPGSTSFSPQLLEVSEEIEREMRGRAQEQADAMASRLRDLGFDVEAHIALGAPTEQLLKEAEAGRFDLVAIGSRGMGPLRRALLGSVSDQIARHARAALVGRRLAS